MSSNKCKNKTTLTNKQKQKIIMYKNQNSNITHVELVDWIKNKFNLDIYSIAIRCLIKNKDDIESNLSKKRQKTVQFPELKNALLEWVLQNQEKIRLSNAILIEKAKSFAQILNLFNSDLKFLQGEEASVDKSVIAVAIPQLNKILKEYNLKDICNINETRLFYYLEPNTILANYTKILPNVQDNKELTINDNDDNLMKEL
ncbi:10290_t:CDS:2 [Cetraspora pellucida]|uniref:10290_t:CDS:1 n=1 Tax=Cetraspora pellucida TaxID=1433469 RepID=A0A9N9C704_9GLOM|nr:10290_t:CDS:2 [Cetraspora pellucida]